MKHLAPKAVWLFFIQSVIAFIILYFFLGVYLGITISAILFQEGGIGTIIGAGVLINIIIFAFIIGFAFIWAKLSYDNYKYEIREDGFRKECGVILKKYVTIPYERIQNVDIYRGIIARFLGLSDLHIQTAGNSGGYGRYGMGAEGRLPGLTMQDAEALRDELIKRSKGQQVVANTQVNPPANQGL